MEFPHFSIDRDEILIEATHVAVDVFELDAALRAGRVSEGAISEANQPDCILAGLESLDGLFGSWVQHIRHHWRDRYSNSLEQLLDEPDQEVARISANALLQMDPTHEPAHRRLIRYHADRANDPAAERQYKLLWDLLAEYDAEPDSQSQHLITQIKLGKYREEAHSQPRPAPAVPSAAGERAGIPQLPFIYVHEFKSVVLDNEATAFATGLRLEFVSNLVRFRDWTVLDASPDHANPGYIEPGSNLASNAFLLEGTIYEPYGERVIVITLKDLRSGAYLWSDRVPVNAEGWFQAQRRITIQIATSLDKHLTAKLAASNIVVHPIENEVYLR